MFLTKFLMFWGIFVSCKTKYRNVNALSKIMRFIVPESNVYYTFNLLSCICTLCTNILSFWGCDFRTNNQYDLAVFSSYLLLNVWILHASWVFRMYLILWSICCLVYNGNDLFLPSQRNNYNIITNFIIIILITIQQINKRFVMLMIMFHDNETCIMFRGKKQIFRNKNCIHAHQ